MLNSIPYNASNWHWFVAGDVSRAWSSARGSYVPISDATYLGWLASGGLPTAIDTEQNLSSVLMVYGLNGPYVPSAAELGAVDQGALNAALAEPGSVVRALALLTLQRINAIDTAINALNTKTALAGNNLPIFTQAQLVSALQALMR